MESSIELYFKEKKIILLPKVIDDENNSWKIKVFESTKKNLPSFVEFHDGALLIVPKRQDVGKYVL